MSRPLPTVLTALALLLIPFAGGPAAAQPAPAPTAEAEPEALLPPGEEIFDRYVEATGGAAAYERLESRVSNGTITFGGIGTEGQLTLWEKAPHLQRSVIESPELGKIEQGISPDGVVWELMLMTGPAIKRGEEAEVALRNARFDRYHRWRELYEKLETVGLEPVDGKPAYRVRVTPKVGDPETQWYDRESGLLVKNEATLRSEQGAVPVISTTGDYREVDGVLLPFENRLTVAGQEIVIVLSRVTHNSSLPDDVFALPDEVAALLSEGGAGSGGS